MADIGPLTPDEIKLVQEHRANLLKLSGWRQGAQALINAFDNEADKADGSLSLPVTLSHIRAALKRAADNYKVY